MGRAAQSTQAGRASGAGQPAARAPRKDAARNRETLLAAAGEVYAERGSDGSLEEIARRAGVGIGTLYRHFPNRDALNEAVYRREVEMLCDSVEPLAQSHDPLDALSTWMQQFARYVARKRGMATALKASLGADNELFTYSHARIREAFDALLGRAAAAGEIRADVDSGDLMRGLGGICMAGDSADATGDLAARLVGLMVDGLRYGAAQPR